MLQTHRRVDLTQLRSNLSPYPQAGAPTAVSAPNAPAPSAVPQSVTANTSFPGLYASVTPDYMSGLHGVAGFDYTKFEQEEPYRKVVMRKV